VWEEYGFEPERRAPTEVRLLNCPFHPLAARSPELVCSINHAFFDGFLVGLRASGIDAVLDPHPGRCCVELRAAGSGADVVPGPATGTCAKEVCARSAGEADGT
jgi:predicted ArsR family transcriptional regulator